MAKPKPVPEMIADRIESRILLIREQKVMISTHLAELYDVQPRRLFRRSRATTIVFPVTSCSS